MLTVQQRAIRRGCLKRITSLPCHRRLGKSLVPIYVVHRSRERRGILEAWQRLNDFDNRLKHLPTPMPISKYYDVQSETASHPRQDIISSAEEEAFGNWRGSGSSRERERKRAIGAEQTFFCIAWKASERRNSAGDCLRRILLMDGRLSKLSSVPGFRAILLPALCTAMV